MIMTVASYIGHGSNLFSTPGLNGADSKPSLVRAHRPFVRPGCDSGIRQSIEMIGKPESSYRATLWPGLKTCHARRESGSPRRAGADGQHQQIRHQQILVKSLQSPSLGVRAGLIWQDSTQEPVQVNKSSDRACGRATIAGILFICIQRNRNSNATEAFQEETSR